MTNRSARTARRTQAARKSIVCALCGLCALLVMPARAFAHPAPFTFLDLRLQRDMIEGSLIAHIFDVAHDLNIANSEHLLEPAFAGQQSRAFAALIAPRLIVAADGQRLTPDWSTLDVIPDRQSVRIHLRYRIASAPGIVTVDTALFPYDPAHQTFLNVYEGESLTQAILDLGRQHFEYFSGTRQGALAVVTRFLPSGITHIAIGPDHLLFLTGLMLMGGTIPWLAVIVTAFTLAHLVTLSAAAFNLVMPPARIIEPAMALSIIYVGADNLLVRGGRDVRGWIAGTFGFIHGFGVAAVLRQMDMPNRALGWSVVSFSLGIEIGQLVVVAVVASALALLRSRNEAAGRQLSFAGSLIVIAAGTFWFFQRVFVR